MSGTPEETVLALRWLCHDLASPVATLFTAAELLGAEADAEVNSLIAEAIRRLAARLRLARLALGAAGPAMAPAALESLLRAALPDTPLTLTLDADSGPPASVLAGAALLLTDLHRASPLALNARGAHWTNGHRLDEAASAALAGQPRPEPRSTIIALIARLARAQGWSLAPAPSGIDFRPL